MGKRRANKQQETKVVHVTTEQHAEKLLATWTTREMQMKLQCSPDEAQQAACLILSMSPQQLREWCNDLLSETEKRMDEDRRFYNTFMDKKEELGLLRTGSAPVPSDASSVAASVTSTSTTATSKSKKGPKYNKKVDLSKASGGLDALLPMSQECNCEATKHKLITNCQLCGKIVCEQEGWGRCYFCGAEVSKDSKPVKGKTDGDDAAYLEREREFLKAVAQRDKLIKFQDERSKRTTIVDDQEDYYESSNPWLDPAERAAALEKERREKEARIARNKRGGAYVVKVDLLKKSVEGLTTSCSTEGPQMLAPIEKREMEELKEEEEEEGNICVANNAYNPRPITIHEVEPDDDDDDEETVNPIGRVKRCPDSSVVVRFDNQARLQAWVSDKLLEYGFSEEAAEKEAKIVVRITNQPALKGWATRFLAEVSGQNFVEEFQEESFRLQAEELEKPTKPGLPAKRQPKGSSRVQTDFEEIAEVNKSGVEKVVSNMNIKKRKKPWVLINSPIAAKLDERSGVKSSNMCLSMHQPWASLLICGIKKHEGRTWGTDFRGRLWIHAASHVPSDDDIADTEAFYEQRGATVFPTHYPTSVLLGCVTVTDCLHFKEYEKKIPLADQESSSEYVFICSNPQLLVLPLPMDGKHKIFALEKKVHEAAKRQAGGRASV